MNTIKESIKELERFNIEVKIVKSEFDAFDLYINGHIYISNEYLDDMELMLNRLIRYEELQQRKPKELIKPVIISGEDE
jgi:hypothetical protein